VANGEIVALGEDGRHSFNQLQNHGSTHPDLFDYVCDVMILAGKDVRDQTLDERSSLMGRRILPKLAESVRPLAELTADMSDLMRSVREQRSEALVAKLRCPH
jgi:ATP-dependent DNA ligase